MKKRREYLKFQERIALFFLMLINSVCFSQFSPTDLPNLTLWLKAETVIESAGQVSEWTDNSGNGFHLTQTNSLNQPLKINNALNGMPVIRFDGINDNIKTIFGQNFTNPLTVFIVMNNTSNNPVFIYDGGNSYVSMIYVSGSVYIQSSTPNISYSKPAPFGYTIFQNQYNTNQSKIFENGVQKLAGTLPASNLDGFTIGTRYQQDIFFFNGDIAEVMVYNSIISGSDKDSIENYFRAKYAPPISLGNDINISNDFCSFNLTPSSGFTNLLWSTGETTSSISVNQSGTYWVEATDIFGYVSRDTVIVSFPTIPPPLNTGICVNESNVWNADMGPGFTYLWSNGAITPSISITTPGTYSVQVTDGLGCTKTSDPFTFALDTYSQTAFLGIDTNLCVGNLLTLQVGAAETVSYLWPASTPAQQAFYLVDTTGNYFVETTNVNGCVAQDTIHVTIIGVAPTAAFAVNNVCDLSAAVFTDNSFTPDSSPVDNWLWTFGEGEQSTQQNPNHIFANGPGTYNVQLYVAQGICGAYHSMPVEVFERPSADFTMSGFCSQDASFFTNQSTDGSAVITAWLWNFGQPSSGLANSSVQPNPSKLFGQTGTYTVTLQVTDANNCVDQEVQPITINLSPTPAFTASAICAGANIVFNNTSSIASPDFIQDYLWDFGDNTYSILPTPNKTFTGPGYHTIGLTVTAGNGCFVQTQEQVFVHAIPVPQISVGPACAMTFTELTDVSSVYTGSVASSSWMVDLGVPQVGSPLSYVFPSAGPHNIQLTTTSDFGCTKDTMIILQVNPALNSAFSMLPATVIAGEPVVFENNSIGATSTSWNFGEGTLSNEVAPTFTFGSEWIDVPLTASLIVSNGVGCQDTSAINFTVNTARFDLEVHKIYVSEQNGYYTVGVELKNVGTALIEYTDVVLNLSNGVLMTERFEDTIFSEQTKIAVFTSKPSAFISTQDEGNDWICAEGTPYSSLGLVDEDWSNNKICKNIEGELPVLIGPNPNPASDQFEFSVLITNESTISVELVDSRGRVVRRLLSDASLAKGLYTFDTSLIGVNSGVYWLRMIGEGVKTVKKIVVE